MLGAKPDHEFYRDGNEYNIVYQGHELRVRAVLLRGLLGFDVQRGRPAWHHRRAGRHDP
jgi:hypothetical protein